MNGEGISFFGSSAGILHFEFITGAFRNVSEKPVATRIGGNNSALLRTMRACTRENERKWVISRDDLLQV